MEKRRPGRGLDALLSNSKEDSKGTAQVALDRIDHNPYQPRQSFDKDELSALSESIRTHGILQPLVVRPRGDRFQLIAGERRLRAAQAAGFDEVPVRVVDFNDQQVLEAALVENIQRSDLNPIEKAQGFQEYLHRFKMTHEELARRLGMDRTTVTNLVRLLELPPEVQTSVRVGQISAGHGRALLAVSDPGRQIALCKEIVLRGHSVRAVEALVKEQKSDGSAPISQAAASVEKTRRSRRRRHQSRKRATSWQSRTSFAISWLPALKSV